MSTEFLDKTGLTYFWGKLKAYFQPKLVSGTNIKTVNGISLLGSGDMSVGGSSLQYTEDAPDSGGNTNNVVQNDVANNVASGGYALAEGYGTTAMGEQSHAEGSGSFAIGNNSHAENALCIASGVGSHAEGLNSLAYGSYSHAQNDNTKASSRAQTAIGKFNVADSNDTYALIIGNGTADNARSNALTVDWNGSIRTPDTYRYTTDWDTTTSPSSNIYKSMFETTDANDDNLAYIGCNYGSDGGIQSVLGLHRNVSGSDIYHTFGLRIDSAGNKYYDADMSTSVNGSTGKLYFYRFGNIVYFSTNGAFRSKSTSISSGTMLTQKVPSGYRPIADTYIGCAPNASNNWRLQFEPDGDISFLGNSAWNANMWVSGMWITGDPLP